MRNIFSGGVLYEDFENQKLAELEEYVLSNNIRPILESSFPDSERLKFLNACGFKVRDASRFIV